MSTSYLAHKVEKLGLCQYSELCTRAPIFQITIGKCLSDRYWIERLSDLLPQPEFESDQTTPVIFPGNYNEKNELDSAYMTIKKIKIPAQYRHSAVIVDGRILKDYKDFVSRNKWANILLLTQKSKLPFYGIIELNPDMKELPSDHESEVILLVMRKFDHWMHERYKSRRNEDELNEIRNQNKDELIEIWNRNEHIVRDYGINSNQVFWQTLRLMVADLLAKFIKEEIYEDESPETIAQTEYNASMLKNCILPGCCQLQMDGIPLEKRLFYNEKDYPEIFKRVMCDMLGDLERLPHIPRGEEVELCPKYRDEEKSYQYYGYVR